MAEYIKREDVIETLGEGIKKYLPDISEEVLPPLLVRVRILPSIDIVHCSDCKYWTARKSPFGEVLHFCEYALPGTIETESEDCCSLGEKK